MKKNILIISTNYGTGHNIAAKAIEEHIIINYPQYNVQVLDPLSLSRPIINKLFAKTGKVVATKFRKFRGKLYKEIMYKNYLKNAWYFKLFCKFFWTKKLQNNLIKINPHIIISTQVGPTILIASKKNLFNAKLISVFTDYSIHRVYTIPHESIDKFCVPDKKIKQQMIEMGIKNKKITITGIPVRPQFLTKNNKNKDEIIKKYQLSKKQPIFLFICGGGLGYNNAFIYFEKLLQSKNEFSYLFISGKNKKLLTKAEKLAKKYNKTGKILGYVEEIDKLINCSDIVFGKPGGIVTSEALNIGVPLCAIKPIPGQETNNALFISNNKFGFYIHNITEFQCFLNKLKNNDINLEEYKKNINNNFKKFSFLDIEKL